MKPTTTRFDDTDDVGQNGVLDYSYVGTNYDYFDGLDRGFIIRCYDDNLAEALFLAAYEVIGSEKIRKPIREVPYEDPFFNSVVRHLMAHENKTGFKALTSSSGQYESIRI